MNARGSMWRQRAKPQGVAESLLKIRAAVLGCEWGQRDWDVGVGGSNSHASCVASQKNTQSLSDEGLESSTELSSHNALRIHQRAVQELYNLCRELHIYIVEGGDYSF
ncbi:unnamed protein product [Arctogadus glacialis]